MSTVVTVTGRVVKLCPFKDERDFGHVELAFEDNAPELHQLADYLASWRDVKATHEDFTRELAEHFSAATQVESNWTTAGLDVRCVVSREPLDT